MRRYAAVVAAAAVLLLPAAGRHRVPDGTFCWFTEFDSSPFLLFIPTRFIFSGPLGSTVAFTASICL